MLKWRSSTNRSFRFVSHSSIFLAVLLAILVVWIGAPRNESAATSMTRELVLAPQSNPVEANHYVYGAIYSVKGSTRSSLVLNNPMMTRARVVRVTLYNKAGKALELPEITLAPAQTKFLDIRDYIPQERLGAFSEGSVEVHYHGPTMGITGQLSVIDDRHNGSFDVLLREDVMFSSSKLDGLWFSVDNQTTVEVFVTNTRPHPTTVTPIIYVDGAEFAAQPLVLDSHVGATIDVGKSLKDLQVRRRFASGGITLRHDGTPGAIAVAGVISNKQRGFSSTMRFIDVAGQRSTKLHGANILIGSTNAPPGFPQDVSFTPRAVVRNTTNQSLEARALIRYTTETGAGLIQIDALKLKSGEVRDLNLTPLINELSEKKLLNAGFELEHDGGPGSVIATVVSIDQSGNYVFDVPLKDPQSVKNVGGNHPWRLDGDNRAIAHIKNIDPITDGSLRELALMITTAAGKYSFPLQLTEAGQTLAVDIRRLRDEQIADNHGNVIPLHITEGQVEWYGRGPLGQFIGRLVQYNPATGVSSSLSCETPCDCEPIYISSRVTPTSITGFPHQVSELKAWETDQRCDGSTYECEVYATFNPDIPTVVEVNNAAFPRLAILGNDHGSATITGTWQVPGPSCGTTIPVSHFIQVTNRQVSVNEVGFTGDHLITKWPPTNPATVYDSPDGSAPTWKSSGNPNLPVAYTKGSNITMFAKLGIDSSAPTTSAKIRVKNGSTVIANKDISVSGTSVTVSGISTGSALETTVKTTTPTFIWEISFNGGTSWAPIGSSGPHKMHWTHATPLNPPFRNDAGTTFSPLYDLALQKACDYAAGAATLSTVISNLNTGVDTDNNYNPFVSIGNQHPLKAYETLGGCQCTDLALLLRGLMRSIGIDGTALFIWAGPNVNSHTRYTRGSTSQTHPTFRIARSAHDSAEVNPHFSFHVVVSANSTWYDPSYGLIYSTLSFTETANNNTPQQVNVTPWSSSTLSGYVCPH